MRFVIVFILAFFCQPGFGQDMILKKDGVKIYCEIQGVDSLSIFYLKEGSRYGSQISKTEVESYFVSDPDYVLNSERDTAKSRAGKAWLTFGFGLGMAMPIAVFASKNAGQQASGLALPGTVLALEAQIKLSKVSAFKLKLHHQLNRLDEAFLQADIDANNPGSDLKVSAGDWKIIGAFAGFNFYVPVAKSNILFIDLELLGGYPKCQTPEIVYKTKNTVTSTLHTSTQYAFAIMPGLGARFYASDEVAISLHANYLFIKPTFKDVTTTYANANKKVAEVTQEISSLNLQVGISFMIY